MKVVDIYTNKIRFLMPKRYPKQHLAVAGILSCALFTLAALPSENAVAKRHSKNIAIPIEQLTDDQVSPTEETKDLGIFVEPENYHQSFTEKVRSGDNLSAIFKRAGLTDKQMMELLQANKKSKRLAALYPGHELTFDLDNNNQIIQLTYTKSKTESFSFTRNNDTYDYQEQQREPDIQWATATGVINNSLYNAGVKAKLDDALIMQLASIFGWDIDFALDMRKNDAFSIVYEERFLDGEKIGNGAILAAEFINQGEAFTALRYEHENGDVSYYTPEGKSMRKAFLRAPLDFRRISSNFNPKRLHPISKTVRPHRGIDYAASRGTPVWSSGNGRVIASGYSKANGNYVFVQHGNNIQTKYLHLHKRHVKKGQRIKQKQQIGTVGSTGYSTAPHLHYEFLMNGVHRNPRTIVNKLPKAKSIATSELSRFKQAIQPQLAELATVRTTDIALIDNY